MLAEVGVGEEKVAVRPRDDGVLLDPPRDRGLLSAPLLRDQPRGRPKCKGERLFLSPPTSGPRVDSASASGSGPPAVLASASGSGPSPASASGLRPPSSPAPGWRSAWIRVSEPPSGGTSPPLSLAAGRVPAEVNPGSDSVCGPWAPPGGCEGPAALDRPSPGRSDRSDFVPCKGSDLEIPRKESHYKITLIALTKKKKRREQETEMSKKHRSGCRQSYLRGGRLKVHFGGSMKLPRHGSVWPIFQSRFFFRPASGAVGRLWPADGRSAPRSAPPLCGGEGGRDSDIFRFPFGSLAESTPGPRLGPGALELPPPLGPLVRLPPVVNPPPPTPIALPPVPPRRDRLLLAPMADITAKILSRSRSLQRGRIPSGISVCSAVSTPSTRRITVFASSSPQSQRSPTCVRMGSLGPVYSHAPWDRSWRGAIRRRK
jgi:hypothetical protein